MEVQVEVLEVEEKVKVRMNDVAVAVPLTVRMAVKRGRQRELSSRRYSGYIAARMKVQRRAHGVR